MKRLVLIAVVMLMSVSALFSQKMVTTCDVSLKASPSDGSSRLVTLVKGTVVNVINSNYRGWYYVLGNGKYGYVKSECLKAYSSNYNTNYSTGYSSTSRSTSGYSGGSSYFSTPSQKTVSSNGATARCRDGSYSYSQNRRGTCSHHGGVAVWY